MTNLSAPAVERSAPPRVLPARTETSTHALTAAERTYVSECFIDYEIKNVDALVSYLVSDIFTPLIGFGTGVMALRRAGVMQLSDLVALTYAELIAISGIGQVRATKLCAGLELLGLSLAAENVRTAPRHTFHPFTHLAPALN